MTRDISTSRRERNFQKSLQRYLRTRSVIEALEEHLRTRGTLWMASLPLDRSEPPGGTLEIIEELHKLRDLRVV